jgi:hypothetical protein
MPLLGRWFLAFLPVACAADDVDFVGPRAEAGADEVIIVDSTLEKVVVEDNYVADVVVEDAPRRDARFPCPVHADACPPECAPYYGYRVDRHFGCYAPRQVISCVDRATEATLGQFCVVRVDHELFRTEERRDGLDPAAWRHCEMDEPDFAIAWQAIPCDQDAP